MAETQKFLDQKGVEYLWSKINMQDYPNNETLMAVINAIDDTKADRNELIQSNWNQNDDTQLDYIQNRTHYDSRQQETVTLLFDGNFDDKEIIEIDSSYKWVKVSDFVPAINNIIGCKMGGVDLGAPFTLDITEDNVKQVADNVYTITTSVAEDITIVYENTNVSGVAFTKGVWFGSWYLTNGTILGYMSMLEYIGIIGELKKLDNKYLNIATDDEIIDMLIAEDVVSAVADSDGALLSDENENILLW